MSKDKKAPPPKGESWAEARLRHIAEAKKKADKDKDKK